MISDSKMNMSAKATKVIFLIDNARFALDAIFRLSPGLDDSVLEMAFRHVVEDMNTARNIIVED